MRGEESQEARAIDPTKKRGVIEGLIVQYPQFFVSCQYQGLSCICVTFTLIFTSRKFRLTKVTGKS